MSGTAQVIQANSRQLPLADNSVDLVVTSPPYFALRSYQDGGEHYQGQIGDEPTAAAFIESLLEVTAECMRVLKPSGSIWVNLGDKYSGGRSITGQTFTSDVRHKSLIGIPWRYALRCIDDLGLILRAEVIWSKPNGVPSSAPDRVRSSHEQWFHFTLQPRYFSSVDEILEAHGENTHARRKDGGMSPQQISLATSGLHRGNSGLSASSPNPLGKRPGSVWTIPTQAAQVPAELGIDHFAAFPMEWPRRIIKGWSPRGVCVECGEGRRPVADVAYRTVGKRQGVDRRGLSDRRGNGQPHGNAERLTTITGYACACPEPTAPTTPSVILDTLRRQRDAALMAKALGRNGITVDMSSDYCRLAEWRTNDRRQMAAALQVEKPDVIHPDQLSLFDEDGAA